MKPDIKIVIPVFRITCSIFVGEHKGNAYKQHIKRVEGVDIPNNTKDHDGLCYGAVVWIRDSGDIETILHELSHLCDHVVEALGINDAETHAYIQGYIGGEFFKKMSKMWEVVK